MIKKKPLELSECRTYGDFMLYQRRLRRLTLQELADKAGVTPSAIHRWEIDKAMPRLSLCIAVADALGISVQEYLTGRAVDPWILKDMPVYPTYGECFGAWRQRKGLTQIDFGRICGVSSKTIQNIEKNRSDPFVETFLLIADNLGIAVDMLIGHQIKEVKK